MAIFGGVGTLSIGMAVGKATRLLGNYYGLVIEANTIQRLKRIEMSNQGRRTPHGLAVMYLYELLRDFDGNVDEPRIQSYVSHVVRQVRAARGRGEFISDYALERLYDVARNKFSYNDEKDFYRS